MEEAEEEEEEEKEEEEKEQEEAGEEAEEEQEEEAEEEEEPPPKAKPPPPKGPKPMSTLCCGESCQKAWQDALWASEAPDKILTAAHETRQPTWRCERRQPIYEALPEDADQSDAAFFQEGVAFKLTADSSASRDRRLSRCRPASS